MNINSAVRYSKLCSCRWQTKVVWCLQLLCYCISYLPEMDSYFCIIGGYLLPPHFRLWTLLTFSFYNYSLTFLILDMLTVYLMDKLLSSPYNWVELLRFSVLVNLSSAICVTTFYLLVSLVIFDKNILYSYSICGLIGLLGGVTVLGRQMLSDKLVVDFPLGKVRYKHIPFVCTLFFAVLFGTGFCGGVPLSIFVTGIFIAWMYLRFFQRHSNGLHGDVNDSFTFAGFFPNHLGPPVSVISSAVFNVLVRFRVCKPPPPKNLSIPPSVVSFTVDIHDTTHAASRYLSTPSIVNTCSSQSVPKSALTHSPPSFPSEYTRSIPTGGTPLPPIPPPISVSNEALSS
ncbi:unnamed protein product [Trichobilharzia szidati]|nr:unnamed protein product [Trichobilharzia szidati]CAH8850073.1 unnamed protein product [Trichobilharzia szidati]